MIGVNPVVLGKVVGSITVGVGPDIRPAEAEVEVEDHRELLFVLVAERRVGVDRVDDGSR